jgi:hypothetical protein
MNRSIFRPQLMQLEDRCTPATLSAVLGGGASAVSLSVLVEVPPVPVMPEIVTVTMALPNGGTVAAPPQPILIDPTAIVPNMPMNALFGPGPVRGLLTAANVDSSVFNPGGT